MKYHPTPIPGLLVVELEPRGDERGFFSRAFCQNEFAQQGLFTEVAQANFSYSRDRGTLRGLHFQLPPHQEAKLVRCTRGAFLDLALDLRLDSPTFGQSWGVELSQENRLSLYVPKGCAHGFYTLQDDTEAFYLVDAFYSSSAERGIRWNDPQFQIQWPGPPVVISDRDRNHPDFDRSILPQ